MAERYVTYEGETIAFTVVRKRVKNVNLRIRPDATVIVSANSKVPCAFIEQMVKEKAPWIIRNIKQLQGRKVSCCERKYITGEIIWHLGSAFPLKVVPVKSREEVILDNAEVFMFVKDEANFAVKERLLKSWYKDEAELIFQRSMENIYPLVALDGIVKPSITLRCMKTRWGSCSWTRQKITLNIELVKTPLNCIDYVLLHELVHFKHHKHDAGFYDYLAALMPDWKERRQTLKTLSAKMR